MFRNGNRFKVLFAIGATILIVGLVVAWLPDPIIQALRDKLRTSGLSTAERDSLMWSLLWWDTRQATVFTPISNILIAVGITMLVYSVISGAFSIAETYKIVKKAEMK